MEKPLRPYRAGDGEGPAIGFTKMLGFFLKHAGRSVWGKLLPTTINVLGWHALLLPGIWLILVVGFPKAAESINRKWPNAIPDDIDHMLTWWQWQTGSIVWLFTAMWLTGFLGSIWDEVRSNRVEMHGLKQQVSTAKVIVQAKPAIFELQKIGSPETGSLTDEIDSCRIRIEGLSVMTSKEPITLSFSLRFSSLETDRGELFELSEDISIQLGSRSVRSNRRVSINANDDVQLKLVFEVRPWRGTSWLQSVKTSGQSLIITDCRNPNRTAELVLPGMVEL